MKTYARLASKFLASLGWLGCAGGFFSCGDLHGSSVPCLASGQGVILSEVMARPRGEMRGGAWVELHSQAAHAVSLEGMDLCVGTAHRIQRQRLLKMQPLEPGAFRVLDRRHGSLPRLPTRAGFVSLMCGDTLLTRLDYGPGGLAPSPKRGVSLSLDMRLPPEVWRAAGISGWCWATGKPYDGANNVGTPGQPNGPCPMGCEAQGLTRLLQVPKPGQIYFSEVMAYPGRMRKHRQWVELFVSSESPVDLNGLTMVQRRSGQSKPRRWTLQADACLSVLPHSYPVVAMVQERGAFQLDVPLAAEALGPYGLSTDASLFQLWRQDTLLDEIDLPKALLAVSWARNGAWNGGVGPAGGGALASVCPSQQDDGLGHRATPGRPNDACMPPR